jgi:hypothetical protein
VIPPVKREVFFSRAQADEIDAAVFAAEPVAPNSDHECHPAAGLEVYAEPVVQIHHPALRTMREEKIAPLESLRDELGLTIPTAEMALKPDDIELLFPGTRPRDEQNSAATLGTRCSHGFYIVA